MEIVGFLTLSLFFPFFPFKLLYTKADMESFAFKLVKITPFFHFFDGS